MKVDLKVDLWGVSKVVLLALHLVVLLVEIRADRLAWTKAGSTAEDLVVHWVDQWDDSTVDE